MTWRDCHYKTSKDPQSFSKWFLQRLYRFDQGRIRIRWSDERDRWIIERKVLVGRRETTVPECITLKRGTEVVVAHSDSHIQSRDGYITIDAVGPKAALEHKLLENLQYFNLERWGGVKNFIAHVEGEEEKAEKALQKKHEDERYAALSSVYDTVKHSLGEAAFVPRNYEVGV